MKNSLKSKILKLLNPRVFYLIERLRVWNLRNKYESELSHLRYWQGPLNVARADWLVAELAKLGHPPKSQPMAERRAEGRRFEDRHPELARARQEAQELFEPDGIPGQWNRPVAANEPVRTPSIAAATRRKP